MRKLTNNRNYIKRFALVIVTFLTVTVIHAQAFITTWKTDNAGTSGSTSITIPTTGTGYNYDVDWNNDGTFDEFGLTGSITHDFGTAGTYTIRIQGTFPQIYFNNGGDKLKLLSINQWGNITWTSMRDAFEGCANLTYTAIDNPNLTSVTTMQGMFNGCRIFNGNVGGWNVSNVTNMSQLFRINDLFNQDISSWNTAKVTNMSSLFAGAYAFNQNIGNWNTAKVTNMDYMFSYARAFNQNVGGWNTSNVTRMQYTFRGTNNFNQNISSWNVSKVFQMTNMFQNAIAFNQNIGSWNVSNAFTMTSMFDGSGMSVSNYDNTLIGWNSLPTVRNNISLGVSGLEYCNGEAARTALMTDHNWTFVGDSKNCTPPTCPTLTGLSPNPVIINSQSSCNSHSGTASGGVLSAAANNCPSGSTLKYSINGGSTWSINLPTYNQSTPITVLTTCECDINSSNTSSNTSITTNPNTTCPTCSDGIQNGDETGVDCGGSSCSSCTNQNHSCYDGIQNGTETGVDCGGDCWPCATCSDGVENGDETGTDCGGSCSPCSAMLNHFVTTWNTTLPGTGISSNTNTRIYIPCTGGGYNYDIDWNNDGVFDHLAESGPISHDFGTPGTYTIRIRGSFPRFGTTGDNACSKITEINQWGNIQWNSFESAFSGCSELSIIAKDRPNLDNVESLYRAFKNLDSISFELENWDVSNITNMGGTFNNSVSGYFNADISRWNTSNVTNMSNMLRGCIYFNQYLGEWNTTNTTDMFGMFAGAKIFNQDISNWNVASVTNMSAMFAITDSFNIDISGWNTSSVTNMHQTFAAAKNFNQNISGWNTSGVTNMWSTFSNATSFNQNLGNWDISQIEPYTYDSIEVFGTVYYINNQNSMAGMLDYTSLSKENYDSTLIGWLGEANSAKTTTANSGVRVGAAGLFFCNGETQRQSLIDNFGWEFIGDAEDCSVLPIELLSFNVESEDNNKVTLNWSTATEINNDYFTIQRSNNGRVWEEFAKVKGAGNSSNKINYSAIDTEPYINESYYRLKQTDFDGTSSYSDIKVVIIEEELSTELYLYPNPTKDNVYIRLNKGDITSVSLYNALGQKLTNTIPQQNTYDWQIPTNNLEPGWYVVEANGVRERFLKVD